MIVFGTRPEAIKMAPVINVMKNDPEIELRVCITGQHRSMLDQVLAVFNIVPDYDLDLMTPNQSLEKLSAAVLTTMGKLFEKERPDRILVQGDTLTAFVTALAAFFHKIPVGHIEAGLRSFNDYSPWPEEMDRKLISDVADLHFAATQNGVANLIRENVSVENIVLTGNTVVDALLEIINKIDSDKELKTQLRNTFSFLDETKKLILVTGHRRENFGSGLEEICAALVEIAKRPDVQIVYPVHLNPNVQQVVNTLLNDSPNIFLLPPQEYVEMIYLMQSCYLILTDSGGIQEEAPTLQKPLLVMRINTERPEGVKSGASKLVGVKTEDIIANTNLLLDDAKAYKKMTGIANPYGDGKAAERILLAILERQRCDLEKD
jgi:UDP-N-acetylglucosamine 2-epimerase (non-hydrolysing)